LHIITVVIEDGVSFLLLFSNSVDDSLFKGDFVRFRESTALIKLFSSTFKHNSLINESLISLLFLSLSKNHALI
jgi:hypothetical protein